MDPNAPTTPTPETPSETSLASLDSEMSKTFTQTVKQRYMDKYADDALKLICEFKDVERAYKVYADWMKRLDAGDLTVLEDYRNKRSRLECEDGYHF